MAAFRWHYNIESQSLCAFRESSEAIKLKRQPGPLFDFAWTRCI